MNFSVSIYNIHLVSYSLNTYETGTIGTISIISAWLLFASIFHRFKTMQFIKFVERNNTKVKFTILRDSATQQIIFSLYTRKTVLNATI